MLFLVPAVVPVHATQNASLPTITVTPTAYITGVATNVNTLKITNPITNTYAITSLTVFAPSGATFSAPEGLGVCTIANTQCIYLTTITVSTSSAVTFTAGAGTGLAAGFSDTLPLGPITISTASPATAAPPTLTFSTTLIDGGSTPGSYPGPTWIAYDLNGNTAVTVTQSSTAFTAGGSPITITANDGSGQPGVPFTFSVTTNPTAGYTASVSPTSSSTGSNGKATTSFQPSNHAGDMTTITAKIGGAYTMQSASIQTFAGNPTTVSWTTQAAASPNFNQGATFYLSTNWFGTGTYTGATRMAEYSSASSLVVSMSDAYNNNIQFGALTNPTIAVSAGAGAGFDQGGASLVTTGTCVNGAFNCANGALLNNYYQPYAYGTVDSLTAIITGNYPTAQSPILSVSSASGNFITGTDAATYTLAATSSATPQFGAGSSIKLTATPVGLSTQPGVPITFNLCGFQTGAVACLSTTTGYAGSFTGGAQTGFVSATGGSSGTATATYTLDPTLNNVGTWNATGPAPTNANSKATIPYAISNTVKTVAGAAASFAAVVYYSDQATTLSAKSPSIVAGQSMYYYVELVDAYGNLASNTGDTAIQIAVTVTAPSTSAEQLLSINSGGSTSQIEYGNVQWYVPSTVAAGTVLTLTMSGVVLGVQVTSKYSVTVVSALPSLTISTPKPTNGYLYSSSLGITFTGTAQVSPGYNPTTTTIASINYKIGSAYWAQAAGTGPNKDLFAFSIFVPLGVSTILFNATDSNKNTVVSSAYTLLVDTSPPTITFPSSTTNTGCASVTVATAEGDLNEALTGANAFSATYGGVAVSAGAITFTGTQTAGTAGSVTANICGLVSGTATLSVTAYTLAGLSATASESLTVTVPFADSVTFNTAGATYGTVGAYSGVTISVTNGWNTAQTLVIYATFKSGTSIYVAVGTVTLAAGATAPVFCIDVVPIPVASYTVTFGAQSIAGGPNQGPVSAPTTPITLVT